MFFKDLCKWHIAHSVSTNEDKISLYLQKPEKMKKLLLSETTSSKC